MHAPRKRTLEEITTLVEPTFSDLQQKEFEHGIELFNTGEYWHAHEAWENAWKEMTDEPKDDAEIFLRGLVQLTAGLHCLTQRRADCAIQNFQKAKPKLSLAAKNPLTPNSPLFLGLHLADALAFINDYEQSPDFSKRFTFRLSR